MALLRELQGQASGEVYIGGLMGCRGDAYTGKGCLSTEEALEFHRWQAEQFRNSPVDFLMAGILPTLPEAMGLAQAMSETGFPCLISFTIQSDGCLIDGTPISDAIQTIDQFVDRPPLGYMTNCVHPTILAQALAQPCNQTAAVKERFLGIQANTVADSYVNLERGVNLKPTGPKGLAREMLRLREQYGLSLLGGCCGTDGRYLEAMAQGLDGRL